MYRSKSRLSYKVVGSLILVFVVIFVTFGWAISTTFENTKLVSEKQKADLLLQTIDKSLQMTLYLKFYDQIEEKVSSVVSVPDVIELSIRDQMAKSYMFIVTTTKVAFPR